MAESSFLLDRAAGCYLAAGERAEAARCYHASGSYLRAAVLYSELGLHREAADAYAAADMADFAIWHLAHHVGDIAKARALKAAGPPRTVVAQLRWRLALARCDVAEQRADFGPLRVLADACAYLEKPGGVPDHYVEQWAVTVATCMGREDQVALLYAAGVRSGRVDAADRWASWSRKVLQCELVLPARGSASAYSAGR
ncbi:hypothetical protein ABH926_002107 [Catenulispora sp. GP43]|uniref:hypothetical protein n=1 Tax=Catenulispora sp. GP43 TaxID=3156263 RepID=UPI003517A685